MHELHNTLKYSLGLAPVVVSDNTAVNSVIVDMAGFKACEFIILTGTLADADATFAVTMTHGDAVDSASNPTSITDAAAVDADSLIGTLAAASFTFAADNAVRTVGYSATRGAGKRWVRLTVTPAANSGAAPLAIAVVRLPTIMPPA